MSFDWAITIAREDARCLGSLRLAPGVEIGEGPELLWLRGKQGDEQFQANLACLPAITRYEWLAPETLRPVDRRIAAERLPNLNWQPLQTWMLVESPASALPADTPPARLLQLVRSTDEREADLLLTSLKELQEFSAQVAEVRLRPLQFAANDRGEVIVRGSPLPPLPGRRFVLHDCIGVPAGFSWAPAVALEVVARCLRAPGDGLVLWCEDNTIRRLQAELFVQASRSALWATVRALASAS